MKCIQNWRVKFWPSKGCHGEITLCLFSSDRSELRVFIQQKNWPVNKKNTKRLLPNTTVCLIILIRFLFLRWIRIQEDGYAFWISSLPGWQCIFIWATETLSFSIVSLLVVLTKIWSLCRSGKRQKEECDYTTARGFPASFLACSSSDRHFHFFDWLALSFLVKLAQVRI